MGCGKNKKDKERTAAKTRAEGVGWFLEDSEGQVRKRRPSGSSTSSMPWRLLIDFSARLSRFMLPVYVRPIRILMCGNAKTLAWHVKAEAIHLRVPRQ